MMWPLVLGASAAAVTLGGVTFYAFHVPSSQLLGPSLVRGPVDGGRVSLTFDDGPTAPFTDQILDILRERKVPATFFLCGKNVQRVPESACRIQSEGHTLGNHTYSHPYLYFLSRNKMAEEIDRTQEVIERATGDRPKLFRPPYGAPWFGLHPLLRERGLQMVQWSVSGHDWKYDTDAIIRSIMTGLGPGSIILLHDGREPLPPGRFDQSSTVKALSTIIDRAREEGLRFVPITDFLLNSHGLFGFHSGGGGYSRFP